jgi:prepilin-type N-terminal cleavage/methylation domain-containing protein
MLTYFSKARNKKGFTIIEMIVVIAIIGVMVAVGVPNFIASQRRAEAYRHDGSAKSFNFALQQTLTSILAFDNTFEEFALDLGALITPAGSASRVSGTPSISGLTANYLYLYVQVTSANTVERATLSYGPIGVMPQVTTSPNIVAVHGTAPAIAAATPRNNARLAGIANELQNYFRLGNNEGHYYAMIDSDFRVVMTYFSRFGDLEAISAASWRSVRENEIAGFVYGAYPREYAFIGAFAVHCTAARVCPAPAVCTTCQSYNPAVRHRVWFANNTGGANGDPIGLIPGI